MRKFLLGFMAFLMLTPVLACGMAFCPMTAAAQVAMEEPCHDMGNMEEKTSKPPMLALDCMGVDLFSQVASLDYGVDQPAILVSYPSWIDLSADYDFLADAGNVIRGPPRTDSPLQFNPPIILTTQRFRV
ncbi:MAG TPA: hypothetical protein PLF01_02345 [Alphaproteobacteria bacterium]|nr:hypothetical protein [Alphaproteobacteria bacterium]